MTSSATARHPEIAIIGLGVIGGSAALRLVQRGTAFRGFAESAADRESAAAAGVPVATTMADAIVGVGLVLLAVPMDAIASTADAVMRGVPDGATILHAGSLQRRQALGVSAVAHGRLIGTHPLTGSHRSGFGAASAELFRGATVFVERRAAARQREDAELLWSLAGAARVEYRDADAHDDAMAWLSHLPQLASTALAATIGAQDAAALDGIPLGPGGRDATRLAMSSLDMWRPILERAPPTTVSALGALEQQIAHLRHALEGHDWEECRRLWDRAGVWRSAAESGATPAGGGDRP